MFTGVQYDSGGATPEYQVYLDTLDYQDVERINGMKPTPKKDEGIILNFINSIGEKAFGDCKHFERFDARFTSVLNKMKDA